MTIREINVKNFKSLYNVKREGLTVDLGIQWEDDGEYDYSVHMTTPTDDDTRKYHSESVNQDGNLLWGRSNRSVIQLNNNIGYFMVAETLNEHRCRGMGKYIEKYGIYQPDTPTLRGTVTDNTQVVPIGLNGGRMADALQEILKSVDGEMRFGTLYYRRCP